jgi:PhnB protein
MTRVNVYLTFDGVCEAAFNFYKSVFGGEFPMISRFSEMPSIDGKTFPEEEGDRIMHISLPVSRETVLMGSDSSETFGPPLVAGNNFSISVSTENKLEADRVFKGLSAGGKVTTPMEITFWGSYFGMLTDKYGINWMVSFDSEPQASNLG